jgi:tagatose 1,6-diphosphate aldolase
MSSSPEKHQRLLRTASPSRTFTILALDHRGPLRRHFARVLPPDQVDPTVATLKRELVAALAPEATAVLLDPELGLPACTSAGLLPANHGLLAALDTGSTGDPAVLKTGLVENWSPAQAVQAGAHGAKLLVYYHPEAPEAETTENLVRTIAQACALADLPLFLEPIVYSPHAPGHPLDSLERRRAVVTTARRLGALGPDILKAEFPVNPTTDPDAALWLDACQELTAACPIPWTLLSGGVPFDTFLRQATIAATAGASGVIAGRAIWNEALTTDPAARNHFLKGSARDRLRRLRTLCDTQARPIPLPS